MHGGAAPQVKRAAERRLTIWSAACSSGQEPYSLAMMLDQEARRLAGWRISLYASDLSDEMLARARAARYSQLEVNRGLPARCLVKYFHKEGLDWQLADALRSTVEFQQINLIGTWPALPRMDVIFLRNVMIYFDEGVRRAVLLNVRRLLRPDGYLFLGSVESAAGVDPKFHSTTIGKARCFRLADK